MLFALIAEALAIGENCANPTSRWDSAYCQVVAQPKKYQPECLPSRLFPGRATDYAQVKKVKGVIIMYHGFTACPDSYGPLSEELRKEGYVTLVPLVHGHGIMKGYECDVKKSDCVGIDNVADLPASRETYMNWVDWSLTMVKEEIAKIPEGAKAPGFFVGAVGLSAGGPLGTFAISRPDSPITRFVAVNPFLSFAVAPLDLIILGCRDTPDPKKCVIEATEKKDGNAAAKKSNTDGEQEVNNDVVGPLGVIFGAFKKFGAFFAKESLMTVLTKNYHQRMVDIWAYMSKVGKKSNWMQNKVLNAPFAWGPLCSDVKGRGGYCGCKIKNLIALHNFAEYAVSQIDNIPKENRYGIIFSERDGPTLDAVTGAIISSLQSRGLVASKCRYRLRCPLGGFDLLSNKCGIPHSSFSRAEAKNVAPKWNYWEKDLFGNIKRFLSGKSNQLGISKVKDAVCETTIKTMGGEKYEHIANVYLQQAKERSSNEVSPRGRK